jgi:hypothetical protein
MTLIPSVSSSSPECASLLERQHGWALGAATGLDAIGN